MPQIAPLFVLENVLECAPVLENVLEILGHFEQI